MYNNNKSCTYHNLKREREERPEYEKLMNPPLIDTGRIRGPQTATRHGGCNKKTIGYRRKLDGDHFHLSI